jgi:hypothetical protein
MTENQEIPRRKRRSSEEIKRLVLEFEASGLGQSEFCRRHSLAMSALRRQVRKRRFNQGEAPSNRLVAVEIAKKDRDGTNRTPCGLEVVLTGGRRIEVRRDFDSATLVRLVEVLEEI